MPNATFNAAPKKSKNSKKRHRRHDDAESVARQIVWSAVKKQYHKDERSGKWVKS